MVRGISVHMMNEKQRSMRVEVHFALLARPILRRSMLLANLCPLGTVVWSSVLSATPRHRFEVGTIDPEKLGQSEFAHCIIPFPRGPPPIALVVEFAKAKFADQEFDLPFDFCAGLVDATHEEAT
jgi:hypothetical protein